MQTFLPYEDFRESARVLDNARLGKQRVECLQIMQAIIGHRIKTRVRKRIDHKLVWVDQPPNKWKFEESDGQAWVNHPAVLMWRQTPRALMSYQHAICAEWTRRGYEDTCLRKTGAVLTQYRAQEGKPLRPAWLGNPDLHRSHQSNLIRKNSIHYLPIFGSVPAMEYVWPYRVKK